MNLFQSATCPQHAHISLDFTICEVSEKNIPSNHPNERRSNQSKEIATKLKSKKNPPSYFLRTRATFNSFRIHIVGVGIGLEVD